MKIILTSAIYKLGKIGDIAEVKNGYAKNFLIPNKKAICLTVNNQKIFESKKHEFEQENQNNLKIAVNIKEKMSGKDVIIIENASDDGRLYGSVNSLNIASRINEITGEKVSRANIFLKKPIKEIGVYQIKIILHSEVSFETRIIVTRNESEIDSLLKIAKNNDESKVLRVIPEASQVNSKSTENSKKKAAKNNI
jgi:large subunit ribosomal protein L9